MDDDQPRMRHLTDVTIDELADLFTRPILLRLAQMEERLTPLAVKDETPDAQ